MQFKTDYSSLNILHLTPKSVKSTNNWNSWSKKEKKNVQRLPTNRGMVLDEEDYKPLHSPLTTIISTNY